MVVDVKFLYNQSSYDLTFHMTQRFAQERGLEGFPKTAWQNAIAYIRNEALIADRLGSELRNVLVSFSIFKILITLDGGFTQKRKRK